VRLQLRRPTWLAAALAVALVPAAPPATAQAPVGEPPPPRAQTPERAAPAHSSIQARTALELAGYTDSDQVHVASPSVSGSVGNELAGWSVSGQYLLDAVSAASVDVVSTASRRWFEYRHVGSASLEIKSGQITLSGGGGLSREPDYLSLAGAVRLTVETVDKTLTPFLGLSYGQDDVGRTGQPRSTWRSMQKWGVQAGGTFVLGRSTIASLAGDAIFERGYLGKPYRYVPLFEPGTGASVPVGASIDEVNRRRIDLRPADALPEVRDRFALTGRLAHRFDGATLRADERLYRDSWVLQASTTDLRLMVELGRRVIIWPHLRLHLQDAVDFWQRAYEATPGPDGLLGVPAYRTGDRELGSLHTLTSGAGLQVLLGDGVGTDWILSISADAIFTRYLDALYLTRRRALFASTSLQAQFD
jgi:hypothetical protein